MTRSVVLVLAASLGLAGCRRPAESPAPKADAHEAEPQADEAHGNASEVRIEEGMMRDLRITTAKVESRRGVVAGVAQGGAGGARRLTFDAFS